MEYDPRPPFPPKKSLILARFDYNEPCGFELHRQPVLQVPKVGQHINIEGNPFIVTRVDWALPSYEDDDE